MAIPNPADECIKLDIVIPDFRWRFPFGVQLDIEYNGLPIPADVVGSLIARANAALLPFVPIFNIIDAILGLRALFDAIKELNPLKIKDELEKWLDIITTLAGAIPQLSIPNFLKDSVYVLILFLTALRADLAAIIESQSAIDLAGERATLLASADLAAVVSCTQANLDFEFAALVQSNAEPITRFIGLVNLFADLAGLPTIPAITLDADPDEVLAQLDTAIFNLQTLYNSLPG
jgi:hypothetical protein